MRVLFFAILFSFSVHGEHRLGAVNPFVDKPELVTKVFTNRVYSHFSIPLNGYAAGISLPEGECPEVNDALVEAVPEMVEKAKAAEVMSDPIRWWAVGLGTVLSGSYFGLQGDNSSKKFRMVLKQSSDSRKYAGWEEVESTTPLYLAVFNDKLGYRHNGINWELLDRTQDPITLKLTVSQKREPNRLYNHFDRKKKGWTWRLSGSEGSLLEWILDAGTTLSGEFFGLDPSLYFTLLKKVDLKNRTDYLEWSKVNPEKRLTAHSWANASWHEWKRTTKEWAPITVAAVEEHNPVTGQIRLVESPEPNRIYYRSLKTATLVLWGYSFATAERTLQPWLLSDATTVKESYFGLSGQGKFKLVRGVRDELTWAKAGAEDPVILISTNWNKVDIAIQLPDNSWKSQETLSGPKFEEAQKAADNLKIAIDRWHARSAKTGNGWADGLTAFDQPGNSPFAGGGGHWLQGDEFAKENANSDPWSRPGFMPFANGGWYFKKGDPDTNSDVWSRGGNSPFSRPGRR